MKYFIAEQEASYFHVPRPVNWFGKIAPDKVHKDTHQDMPNYTALPIEADEQVEFLDVIFHPVFAVSDQVQQVLKLYEPNMVWKELMLYDKKNKLVQLYHVPMLWDMACLTDKSKENLGKGQCADIQINQLGLRDKSIFLLASVQKRYVVMRLDLVESLLRRNVTGLHLIELDVISETREG